ncbi:type 2A phosphatase activator TIP41 [Dacryopinax primogenitus]|uniref:Type 2A phosphatase activator TIP41 n=1 Tax=Dacryopinax primogenitus (strain DJM 731) TaxID=1858805 RepID=M5GGZ7_DACPD|nr:type 2A phosphatase activator TIP41 [Dacryopinax primogenitus]EJU06358.1 type 2A phosphatase activator TIP41 [Dacryopinax primogenitus]
MTTTSPEIPSHHVDETGVNKSITIHGWKITTTSTSISNASELDSLQRELDLTLPEMTFGHNSVVLSHEASGWTYTFDTKGALKQVCNKELGPGDGGVKVGHAEAWASTRTVPNSLTPVSEMTVAKPYDWTYTTMYAGHASTSTPQWLPADPEDSSQSIPMATLTKPDPILYYAATQLFEDELHDNGASMYIIRVRVMPTCFFLLGRFSLRVDHVLFRQHDTRLFHDFSSNMLIRETAGWEAPYETIRARLPNPDDRTRLTDTQWVASIFNELPTRITQNKRSGGGTGWRGLTRRVETILLGRDTQEM